VAILAVLNEPGVTYVNLTPDERKAPSIGPKRLPYVHNTVGNVLPLFPNLASGSIPLDRTTTLLGLVSFVDSVKPYMMEIVDRFTDVSINAENLVYKSMGDSYDLALRQEGRMPGADVLIAAIAPLFADQGKKKSGPATPPGDGNTTPGDGNSTPDTTPPAPGNGSTPPAP
jgi:hypothetical protein